MKTKADVPLRMIGGQTLNKLTRRLCLRRRLCGSGRRSRRNTRRFRFNRREVAESVYAPTGSMAPASRPALRRLRLRAMTSFLRQRALISLSSRLLVQPTMLLPDKGSRLVGKMATKGELNEHGKTPRYLLRQMAKQPVDASDNHRGTLSAFV